jgi:hypothetical protein
VSSEVIQRSIEVAQRRLERLQRQLTDVTRDEARRSDKMAQLTADLSRARNPSVRAMKERAILTCQRDLGRLHTKRVDLNRHIADQTADLHRWQQKLYREQAREQQDALAAVRMITESARSRQSAAVNVASSATFGDATVDAEYDAFISHATEDKDDLVRPLADKLTAMGFNIWYDEFRLSVGDSLRRSIDRGLAASRFGIVVLSPFFFQKNWPQYELDGLVARESGGGKIILPLWHKVTKDQVLSYSPSLADKVALNTSLATLDEIVAALEPVLRCK